MQISRPHPRCHAFGGHVDTAVGADWAANLSQVHNLKRDVLNPIALPPSASKPVLSETWVFEQPVNVVNELARQPVNERLEVAQRSTLVADVGAGRRDQKILSSEVEPELT